MEVDTMMLADGAQAVGGKMYILGGNWNVIGAMKLPTEHRLSVAIGLRVDWNEANVRHRFLLTAEDLDGNLVQELTNFEFEMGRPPGMKPGSDQVFSVAIDAVLKLEAEGELQIVLSVDGNALKKAIPFRVVKATVVSPPSG